MRKVLLILPVLFLCISPCARTDSDTTEKSEAAVEKGINWLLLAQNTDGSWGLDKGTSGDITCTALAAMAIMSDGTTERNGPRPRCVRALRKGLEYLLKKARAMRSDIAGTTVTLIQNKLGHKVHNFFATVFFTQIYGMRPGWVPRTNMDEIKDYLAQLTHTIAKSQEADGSWHKNTFGSLKATCMAWLALRAANSSGIDVNDAAIDKTLAFIRKQYNSSTKMFDRMTGQGSYQTVYATATCIRVLFAMGEGNTDVAQNAAKALIKFIKGGFSGQFLSVEGEDYMSAALISQALLHEKGKLWDSWFPWIRDALVKKQARDGSWTGTACISGRTFATACSLLTLQTPYRLLPIMEQ